VTVQPNGVKLCPHGTNFLLISTESVGRATFMNWWRYATSLCVVGLFVYVKRI